MNQDKSKIIREVTIIIVISLISFFLFSYFDAFEKMVNFSYKHEEFKIDEILSTSMVFMFLSFVFVIRRWRDMIRIGKGFTEKNKEFQSAMDNISQLKGILPFCSFCNKIRDDSGYWEQVDIYIKKYSMAEISHSVCPECMKKHYPKEYAVIYLEK